MRRLCLILILLLAATVCSAAPSMVKFDSTGTCFVNGRPFFPVGIFTYELNGSVLAELHQQQFNTVITLTEAHRPDQLDLLKQHGLMAICPTRDDWLRTAKSHPSLLAWYLTDEPEGHGGTPEGERERYLRLKHEDPNHPVGLDHFLWEAIEKYRDACDFTMTDVYPITANRDVPITHVGKFMDEARRVHGPGWPHWPYIQIFGGPDTDGGKWAQPLPDEIRCMTYIALVHRANGILYFPYWAKVPRAWDEVGRLNREIHRLAPWLVASGEELPVASSDAAVQVRCRRIGKSGVVILVNTGAAFVDAEVTLDRVPTKGLTGVFEPGTASLKAGRLRERLAPYETRVYTWGAEPAVNMATGPTP